MGDVIKFRDARKKQARKEKDIRAASNRAYYGLTKAQKEAAKKQIKKDEAHIKGHEIDESDPERE